MAQALYAVERDGDVGSQTNLTASDIETLVNEKPYTTVYCK